MKKIHYLLLVILTAFSACELDNEPNPEPNTTSQVVEVVYPEITLNGDAVVSTGVGSGAYVDPGASAFDATNGSTTTLSPVSNNVDLTTPGFYSVKYSAKNQYGYESSKSRLVLVTSVDPNIDISGVYARTANNVMCNITKRGVGLYTTDNVGGVGGIPDYIFDVYFGMIDNSNIAVPVQPNALGGDIYCDVQSFSMSASDTTFAWIVRGAGFGTAVRTFVHQ